MMPRKITKVLMAPLPFFFIFFSACGEDASAPSPRVAQKTAKRTAPGTKAVAVPKKEEVLDEKKEIKYIYDPSGKRDPFQPSQEYMIDLADVLAGGDDPNLPPPTPPEMFELSQLKLVAIMNMPKKSVAMVEDPDGKGHTIYVGSFVGKNRGKVARIEKSKVLIEERARTSAGTYKTTVHELIIETREGG